MTSLSDRRFTDSAQRIVEQFTQRAFARGLLHLDDAAVVPLALWTLIRWKRKVGLVVLEKMGVDLHRLADQLDTLLTRLANDHPVAAMGGVAVFAKTGRRAVIDRTQAIQPLLAQAESEARKLKHNYVGTEHLLLAIITRADSRLSPILQSHLVTYESTKETVFELLGS